MVPARQGSHLDMPVRGATKPVSHLKQFVVPGGANRPTGQLTHFFVVREMTVPGGQVLPHPASPTTVESAPGLLAGQAWHAELAERLAKNVAGQGVHTELPGRFTNRPGGHAEQEERAPSENVPTGQFWHAPKPFGENFPGAQREQADIPVRVPSVPGWHCKQTPGPVTAL